MQEHQNEFEKEVYGPPIVSCSIKDPKYADLVETLLQQNDFLAITAQTSSDWTKLRRQFFEVMNLGEVTIKRPDRPLSGWQRPVLSQSDMQGFGFDCWALDLVDGPEAVLSMLCESVRLNATAISLSDVSESQHNMIVESGAINSWIAGRSSNRVTKRAEYGSGAVSITTRSIKLAKHWTEKPMDLSKRQEIQSKIDLLAAEFEQLRQQVQPVRNAMDRGKTEAMDAQKEVVSKHFQAQIFYINLPRSRKS